MFEQSVLPTPRSRAASLALSLSTQGALLGLGLLAPLIYFQQLGHVEFRTTAIEVPRMAPPPPPMQELMHAVRRRIVDATKVFIAPAVIPRQTPIIKDMDFADVVTVPGFPANAIELGHTNRVNIGDAPPPPEPTVAATKPPEPVKPKGPLRVGGSVMAARILHQVKPIYPPLARNARISGTVKLTATISKDGTIQNLQLLSGHPLLVNAALEAVRQWRYQPTLLNNEPVEVLTQIDVNFLLGP